MSAKWVGRPKNPYTDKLLDFISTKLWKYFISDSYYRIPSNDNIERLIIKNKAMKKYRLSVKEVIYTIRNYKELLKAKITMESRKKFRKETRPNGKRMRQETSDLIELMVDYHHRSFLKKPLPRRGACNTIYQEVCNQALIEGIGNFNPEKIRNVVKSHANLLIVRFQDNCSTEDEPPKKHQSKSSVLTREIESQKEVIEQPQNLKLRANRFIATIKGEEYEFVNMCGLNSLIHSLIHIHLHIQDLDQAHSFYRMVIELLEVPYEHGNELIGTFVLDKKLYSGIKNKEVNCYDHFDNFLKKIEMPWSAQLHCSECEQNNEYQKLSLYFEDAREIAGIDKKINDAIKEFCGCPKSNVEPYLNDIVNVEVVMWHDESQIAVNDIPATISVEGQHFFNSAVICFTANHFFSIGRTKEGSFVKYDDGNREPVLFSGSTKVIPQHIIFVRLTGDVIPRYKNANFDASVTSTVDSIFKASPFRSVKRKMDEVFRGVRRNVMKFLLESLISLKAISNVEAIAAVIRVNLQLFPISSCN